MSFTAHVNAHKWTRLQLWNLLDCQALLVIWCSAGNEDAEEHFCKPFSVFFSFFLIKRSLPFYSLVSPLKLKLSSSAIVPKVSAFCKENKQANKHTHTWETATSESGTASWQRRAPLWCEKKYHLVPRYNLHPACSRGCIDLIPPSYVSHRPTVSRLWPRCRRHPAFPSFETMKSELSSHARLIKAILCTGNKFACPPCNKILQNVARAFHVVARTSARPAKLDRVSNQYSVYHFAAPRALEVELTAENRGAPLKSCKYNLSFFFWCNIFFYYRFLCCYPSLEKMLTNQFLLSALFSLPTCFLSGPPTCTQSSVLSALFPLRQQTVHAVPPSDTFCFFAPLPM